MKFNKQFVRAGFAGATISTAFLALIYFLIPDAIVRSPGECGNTLVINLDLAEDRIPDWTHQPNNRDFIISRPAEVPVALCARAAYIDIRLLGDRNATNPGFFLKWLKDNASFICYESSDHFIECEHAFKNIVTIDRIKDYWVRDKMKVREIEDAFIAKKAVLSRAKYDWFVKFTFTGINYNVEVEAVEKFVPGDNCFSAAFINSIINNHGLNSDSELIFRRPRLLDSHTQKKERKLVFSFVKDNEEFIYNFSQVPQLFGKGEPEYSPL